MTLAQMTACQLKQMLESRQVSCREIMLDVFEQIGRREPEVQAFIHIEDKQRLLDKADDVDRRRKRGEHIGNLAGLPVAVKDILCTCDMPTTCASKMLQNFVPPYDATAVRRIKEADGIIIGKTNLDEFAMGSSTENSAMQVTRNPHNPDYVPGGTSGGSAAAVAASECILAVGTDTGGSVRQPASFCGVVGMKPTYGRVSRYGLIAYASSLDQVGVVAKDVSDAALLLQVMAGHDPLDSTSLDEPVPDYRGALDVETKLRIGVPKEYSGPGVDDEVRQSVESAIALMGKNGHEIIPVSLPHTEYAVPTYYIIACAEASSNLARYDGCQYGFRGEGHEDFIDMVSKTRSQGFGPEVKRRIMLGTYVLSSGYYDAYYLKAAKVRRLVSDDFRKAFKSCDVLMHPVAPTPAFKIGEKVNDPLAMYLGDIFSVTANLAGIPAISVPCGRTKAGLPIGVQVAAKVLDEPVLFAAARQLETLLSRADQGTATRS